MARLNLRTQSPRPYPGANQAHIAPQKPQPLQSKENHYFKVSEQVMSPIETLFSAHHRLLASRFTSVTLTPLLTSSFSAATSDPGQQHQCNSITLDCPRARTRDPLHTLTTVPHEASLAIAPQKPRPLQSKGNHYFKVSEQVTSPIETLFSAHHR